MTLTTHTMTMTQKMTITMTATTRTTTTDPPMKLPPSSTISLPLPPTLLPPPAHLPPTPPSAAKRPIVAPIVFPPPPTPHATRGNSTHSRIPQNSHSRESPPRPLPRGNPNNRYSDEIRTISALPPLPTIPRETMPMAGKFPPSPATRGGDEATAVQ